MGIWSLLVVALLCAAVTAHPPKGECCDICKQVIEQSSNFFTYCGADLTSILVVKMYKDCNMLKADPAKLKVWKENVILTCKAKNGADITFDCPEIPACPPCDLCDELAKDTCFVSLSYILRERIMAACKALTTEDQKKVFFNNMALTCASKNLKFVTPKCPDCEECPKPCPCPDPAPPCPVCEMLKHDACIIQLDEIIRDNVLKACNRLLSQNVAGQMEAFFDNLALICEAKEYGFEKPKCEPCVCPPACDICEDVENSDCYKSLPGELQSIIIGECDTLTTDAEFQDFVNRFKKECDGNGQKYEPCKKCECKDDCDPCDVIANTQCLMDLDPLLKDKLVAACHKLTTKDQIAAFMNNVELVCGEKEFQFEWECPCDCKECKKPKPAPPC